MAIFETDFTVHVKRTLSDLRNYERRQVPTIIQRALNKTLNSTFTLTKRVMSRKISMTQGDIGKRLKKIPAHNHNGVARLRISIKKPPNLARFKHSHPKKTIKGKKRVAGKGIYAKAWEKRILYRGAFEWNRNESQTIFKRRKGAEKKITKGTGEKYKAKRGGRYKDGFIAKGQPLKRQPLDPVFGPDLAQVFLSNPKKGQAPRKIILRLIPAIFKKNFDYEVKRSRRR